MRTQGPSRDPPRAARQARAGAPSRSTRHRVLRDISAHGPTTVARIAARLGLPAKTVYHHAARLVRQGHVHERTHGRRRLLAAPHGPSDWRRAALLEQPALARIHAIVAQEPGIAQAAVVERLTRAGWKRSTAQHRIRRCTEQALLVRRRAGRSLRLLLPDAGRATEGGPPV